ncbi:hypothetical protein [Variovorax gossypii]
MAAFAGHQLAMQAGLARLREAADHRLDMLATGLDADLARFDYLPALLEMTPIVPALLDTPSDTHVRDAVNRYLDGVNATAGAEMLYVLDRSGISQAASDWNKPGTTLGQDLSFRPYVIDALSQGRGRFYGVGITREPLKTAVFSPSLTQAVRNPQICLFFVQFRLFLGFFVPHSSRIGPLQAHLGL